MSLLAICLLLKYIHMFNENQDPKRGNVSSQR